MSDPADSTQKSWRGYDEWYSAGAAPWEDAPGKNVVLSALKACCAPERSLCLLDIGCGSGSFLARVHSEVSEKWKLHGVDISRAAIDQATRAHPRFRFVCADATRLRTFAGSGFDVVTSYGTWEHFGQPDIAIAEAAGVLTKGGMLFAMLPTLGVYRDDRDDEGWYEDHPQKAVEGRNQMQWNLRRETWTKMFHDSGFVLLEDTLPERCGALKPGVFYFGIRVAGD